jgi:Protein of unknown function (DUF2838)
MALGCLTGPAAAYLVLQCKLHPLITGLGTRAGLLFIAGAAPWALPGLFVLFVMVCMPWRAVSFARQKWTFFLIDFCYFVNATAVLFLLFAPDDARLEALTAALADGPLAAALAAWQCPWLFGSGEHTVSVLMHMLPGLALFAHRYHTPPGLRGWRGMAAAARAILAGTALPRMATTTAAAPGSAPAAAAALASTRQLGLWLVVVPLLYYVAWQLLYFLVVQARPILTPQALANARVCMHPPSPPPRALASCLKHLKQQLHCSTQVLCRQLILTRGFDTSYSCLARRAAKTNNVWNRLVRRGSVARRVCMYGALQLAFTCIALAVFLPTFFSYRLSFALQVCASL